MDNNESLKKYIKDRCSDKHEGIKYGHVISLYGCQPFTIIPNEIGIYTNIWKLKIADNQITNIPHEIGKLTNLRSLQLYQNKITSMPKEIGNCINLDEIHMFDNKISCIPKEIGNLINLSLLDLRENQITEIPKEICNLPKLTGLYLDNNQITEIPKEIGRFNNSCWIYLRNNLITSIPEEIYGLNYIYFNSIYLKHPYDSISFYKKQLPLIMIIQAKGRLNYLRKIKRENAARIIQKYVIHLLYRPDGRMYHKAKNNYYNTQKVYNK